MSTPLARLAPKTLVPTGEGFGGHLRLEQCDVAYALSGLKGGPAALLRAMYAGDTGQGNMRDLYLWAWQEAADVAAKGGWAVPRGVMILRKMSDRAVNELVYPHLTLCPHCSGAKSVQPNQHNPNGDCRLCNGQGVRVPTAEEMADVLGVSSVEWANVWAMRYMRLYARLLEWHAYGMRHVRRKLREEE